MKRYFRHIFSAAIVISIMSSVWGVRAVSPGSTSLTMPSQEVQPADSDTTQLRYPIRDRYSDKYNEGVTRSPLSPRDPSNITDSLEYDPKEKQYNINENMGKMFYRNPSYLTFDEFKEKSFDQSTRDYWIQRASEEDALKRKTFAPKLLINSQIFERIFGGNSIDIRPQGSAELIFAINNSKNENPALPVKQRSVTNFDFKEKIQMNVTANIGEKMKLAMNYNTEATFEFENKMKLEYTGQEDDIIKKIEAGNVTLPLNSQLIQGSQSLFGIKTQLQFGRLMVTSVFSQQKGKSQTIEVQGGAQTQRFEIKGDQYEANRHFFLGQYFRNNYEPALKDINQIRSSVNITKIEIWVRNTTTSRSNDATRNIIALADLGEAQPDPRLNLIVASGVAIPTDLTNNLYAFIDSANLTVMRNNPGAAPNILSGKGLISGQNYVVQENARLLSPSEFNYNPLLGYISLNSELAPNQILAVAYEYTYNGKVYTVGELSTKSGVPAPAALFVKLIRSTTINPAFYTWDLMMKNIYNIGGYQLKAENFRLDVLYQDDRIGGNINYLPAGCRANVPLLELLGLDKLNTKSDPQPDGVFDYKEGITINSSTGRIIFPVVEPFGSSLTKYGFCDDTNAAGPYVYQLLYDTTRVIAQQQAERNKFSLRGSYQSSSSNDIPLNAVNVPQGSVKVTSGGVPLKENVDYTVDYTLGRVKIINESYLKSNTPIQVSLESQSLFNIQTKTMWGSRFDYTFNKDFQVGATVLHLTERPFTKKVNYGDEPISNTVVGTDVNYRTDSRFLTQMLDRLPLYSTKETSSITLTGEVAKLFPGHTNTIGQSGVSYVDDFEGAITPYDIKTPQQWYLASTPTKQTNIFPEDSDGVVNGYNRARIAWYYVDQAFQQDQAGLTPPNIGNQDFANNYVRDVPETEIFPNKQSAYPRSLICTNLAFYPAERGPYNYDAEGVPGISAGVDRTGLLKSPETRWGGIMRKLETTDFQNANIEFLQFWMMDPFADDSPNDGTGGQFYIDIGDVSEDVLRDNHKSYENGIFDPSGANQPDTSAWGLYPDPNLPQIGYSFDADPGNRAQQDVGLDGLSDNSERIFFNDFITRITNLYGSGSPAVDSVTNDPSSDNYHYYFGDSYDNASFTALERYKRYNNMEGNSPTGPLDGQTVALGNQYPDFEDLNRDFTMTTEENYFQYKMDLQPAKMNVGENYITDIVTADVKNLPQGVAPKQVKWYQFKIPIKDIQTTIGAPNLTYINSIRMFMRGFKTPVILRFAKLEFLRGEWRKYENTILEPGLYSPQPSYPGNTLFDVTYVSIEENSSRQPINYVLPPGIERERDIQTTTNTAMNEQALSLKVCNLTEGDARAMYKNTQFDMRAFKKMKMFLHAESSDLANPLKDGEMKAFIRVGSDFVDNYYEYEVPLYISPLGDNNRDHVWPEQNNIEISLDELVDVKTQRNAAGAPLTQPYSATVTYNGLPRKVTVKGSPNLSNVRTLMIGVRNPKDNGGTGRDLCGEIWVNELRLSDFDEKGGWATTARVQTKLADLGNATLTGSHSTEGWGSIEKKVNERDKMNKTSYDVATNIELGKFLPEKTGIKVPAFFQYGEHWYNPQYNPLDPDVVFVKALDAAPTSESRDTIRRAAQDYEQRKSINFTQVRKTKVGANAKPHVYDVENISLTYAYTEFSARNYNIDHSKAKTHQGIIAYNYNNTPKPIEPFKNAKALNSPFLKLIKDFNFYLSPNSISLQGDFDRSYAETQLRNNTEAGAYSGKQPTTYVKTFDIHRLYGLRWDLTRSLKFDFSANAASTIDEPYGRTDTKESRDTIRKQLLNNLGRLTSYHHTPKLTYNLPLSKIPFVDWISGSVEYSADYSWQTGRLAIVDTIDELNKKYTYEINSFKNTIQNAKTERFNANVNLTSLYNKSASLKKILAAQQPPKPGINPKNGLTKAQEDTIKKQIKSGTLSKAESDSLRKVLRGRQVSFLEPIGRLLLSVKNVSGNYSITDGTLVPGFDPKPNFLGMDFNYQSNLVPNAPVSDAPGWGFILGSQKDLRPQILKYKWLTPDTALNSSYVTTHQENFSGRAGVEPFRNVKIDLTFTRNFSKNTTEYYRSLNDQGDYQSFNRIESGSFTISYLTWNTAFIEDNSDYTNETFENFREYRKEVSSILSAKNPYSGGLVDTAGYHIGYGPTQQEVLTYAFLSAYTGKSPTTKRTERFPKIPMPNWRVTYDGLSKMKPFQNFMQSFNISHGYRSTYSINSYTRNLLFPADEQLQYADYSTLTDTIGNFISRLDYQMISVAEQFAPLFGMDMTFTNTLQARFEIKKDRTISLSYSNLQITEVKGTEYTFGTGYRLRKFKMPFIKQSKSSTNTGLNLRGDFSLRRNITIIRKLVEGTNQSSVSLPSAGSTTVSVKLSADYNINDRFNVKAFADKTINEPFVSTSFPTSNLYAGFSVRFTLAQ